MAISLTIDLTDRDPAHFNNAMQSARKAAEGKPTEEIIEAASKLLVDAQKVHVPDFILERLLQLDNMIAMVRDTGWALSEEDKQRVLSALMYFADPADVIPDHIEGTGYGSSSGYAAKRTYTRGWRPSAFKFG